MPTAAAKLGGVLYDVVSDDVMPPYGLRGWNLEMQMRMAAARMRVIEVPVGQRRRAGGVSGNWWVAVRVAAVPTATFLRLALRLRSAPTAA